MTRYEIVRDADSGDIQRHPEQPENGFASAVEASLWCDAKPRSLDGSWYISPVEASNG